MIYARCGIAIIHSIIASCFDCRTRRIPNWLNFSGILLGILLLIVAGDYKDLGVRMVAVFILFFVGMTPLMSLGDIKLLMAITLYLGVVALLLVAATGAFVMILFELLVRRKEATKEIQDALFHVAIKRPQDIARAGKKRPFAPFLSFGVILATALMLGGVL